MMQKGFVGMLILSVLIVIFAVSNSALVSIDFLFTKVQLSQAIVIFICVLLGAILASLLGWVHQLSIKKNIKELKLKNQALELEVVQLKALLPSESDQIEEDLVQVTDEMDESELPIVEED